jgi:transposase
MSRSGLVPHPLAGICPNALAIRTRFSRWAKSGVWKRLLGILANGTDNEYDMIDRSTARSCGRISTVRAHKKAGEGQAIRRSKGGLSTKIHGLVDALGNPLNFILTPGQAHDLDGADALLPAMAAEVLLADKAFDADERVIGPSLARGKSFVIHPRATAGFNAISTRAPTRPAISSRISSASASNTAPLPPATTKLPEISSPQIHLATAII